MKNTTLCYIECGGSYLMLHRVKKKNDENHDKWIGIGGHFEENESPFDCMIREIREETSIDVPPEKLSYRGIVTFISASFESQQMHLFKLTGVGFEAGSKGRPVDCDEGVLEWIPKEKLMSLPMWDGDEIFLKLLDTDCPFFSLRLEYSDTDELVSHELHFAGKEPLLVSACLLGTACRYDGRSKPLDALKLEWLKSRYALIPVCPEQLGGLMTPRPPCEINRGRVVRRDGEDLTEGYRHGASETLRLAKLLGIKKALLKAKSPSCGVGRIYDGSFSGRLVDGDGVAAAQLRENGLEVMSEDDFPFDSTVS